MRHILQSLFGLDLSTAQKVIIASVVILVLLILLGLFVRQIQGGRLRMKGQGGGRARQPRLGVVDAHNLDRQRQLILIRRDNVEHLIMIGGASDVVVETNIMRSGARTAAQPIDYATTERPQAFDSLVPQEPARQEPLRQEPARQEPVAVAQPRPDLLPPLPTRQAQAAPPSRPVQSQTQADAAMAVAAAIAVPAAVAAAATMASSGSTAAPSPAPAVQPPSFARDHASSPTASAVELDNMSRQLEEALKRPFSSVRPANSPGEPPAAAKPDHAPDVAPIPAPVAETEPAAVEPLPMPTPPAPPEISGRPIALPADVEAELELALGLKPERITPASPGVRSGRGDFAPEPEPVAEPEPPAAAPVAAELTQMHADDLIIEASEDDGFELPTKPLSEPEAETLEPETVASEVKIAEPEPKPAAIDPFSVDAIEAEFARLLGRDPKGKS